MDTGLGFRGAWQARQGCPYSQAMLLAAYDARTLARMMRTSLTPELLEDILTALAAVLRDLVLKADSDFNSPQDFSQQSRIQESSCEAQQPLMPPANGSNGRGRNVGCEEDCGIDRPAEAVQRGSHAQTHLAPGGRALSIESEILQAGPDLTASNHHANYSISADNVAAILKCLSGK